ncbi:hypothetical protein LguiA_030926 [Lonicera macranthoides]
MAYFVFTKDILERKPITIFEGADHGTVARDFTYIDDVVKGCLAALDNAKKSTGSGGKKKGKAQFRIFNFSKLVSILEKLLKVKANTKVLPMPGNGDVQFTHANINLHSPRPKSSDTHLSFFYFSTLNFAAPYGHHSMPPLLHLHAPAIYFSTTSPSAPRSVFLDLDPECYQLSNTVKDGNSTVHNHCSHIQLYCSQALFIYTVLKIDIVCAFVGGSILGGLSTAEFLWEDVQFSGRSRVTFLSSINFLWANNELGSAKYPDFFLIIESTTSRKRLRLEDIVLNQKTMALETKEPIGIGCRFVNTGGTFVFDEGRDGSGRVRIMVLEDIIFPLNYWIT